MTKDDFSAAITALVTEAIKNGLHDADIVAGLTENLVPFSHMDDAIRSVLSDET